MCRRLAPDGLVEPGDGPRPGAHGRRPGGRRRDLPAPRPARVAADVGRRPRLGRVRRRGDAPPGRALAAGRGASSTRCSGIPRPARTATRSTSRPPAAGRRATPSRARVGVEGDGPADHRGGRGGRGPAVLPRGPGADARGARSRSSRGSESLDSLTLDGPRGRATLGLRPAALIRVLPGDRRSRPCSTRCRRRFG